MHISPPPLDHYEILGLSRHATPMEIREAYLALVKIYHPDLAIPARKGAAVQIFQMITAAYATLSKPSARRRYDAELPPEMPLPPPSMANDNRDGFWERLFR